MGRPRKSGAAPADDAQTCRGPGPRGSVCGRPVEAKGLCQSHRKEFNATGRMTVLKEYRRGPEAGFRRYGVTWSSQEAAAAVKRAAAEARMSVGAFIADRVERAVGFKRDDDDGSGR